MFDGTCRLFERIVGENDEIVESDRKSLGIVDLKILYDDDVYGARIVAVEHDQVRDRLAIMQKSFFYYKRDRFQEK